MNTRHPLVQRALDLLKQPAGTPKVALKPRGVRPGTRITWQRAGKAQHGTVDFVHTDEIGTVWAFVTVADGSWAAVNMKFARGIKP